MSQGDKLLGQPRNDTFGAAIEFRREQARLAGKPVLRVGAESPWMSFGRALATFSGKI